MGMVRLAFTPRFIVYTLSILLTTALLLSVLAYPSAIDLAAVPLVVFAGFAILGTRDLIQTRHAVLRNYPISAHLRFLLERMRPEMRQYFFEDEKDGRPFSRDKRAVAYQRAKMVLDKRPFGTQYDVYAEGFEWVRHSAPYLHNNSVGEYNGDPSIAGRMAAYEDGMSKLLWPERRRDLASVKVTTEDSNLPDLFPFLKTLDPELAAFEFGAELLRVPKGTPINLITNVHPKDAKSVLMAYLNGVLDGRPKEEFNKLQTINCGKGQAAMLKRLLEVSTCPDFIEDKGHYYGHDLSDEDKRATS
jgi:hypothetical protein